MTTLACLVATWIIGLLYKPTDMDVLVSFYSKVRPFGFWGPVRREALKRGLVPARDFMPAIDAVNGILCAAFQFSLAMVPFSFFLRQWTQFYTWLAALVGLGVVLYFTWYKTLPPADEGIRAEDADKETAEMAW